MRYDLLEILIDWYSNLDSTEKLNVELKENLCKFKDSFWNTSILDGNVKFSKFSVGLFEKSQLPEFGRLCLYLLNIHDEKARYEYAEFLHSESILSCPKYMIEYIARSEGNKILVKWLIKHGYYDKI